MELTAKDIVEHSFEKMASLGDREDRKPGIIRDGVLPETERGIKAIPAALAGSAIGSQLGKYKVVPKVQVLDQAGDVVQTIKKGIGRTGDMSRMARGASIGATAAGLGAMAYMRNKKLNRLADEYLGGKVPTGARVGSNLGLAASVAPGLGVMGLATTPEAYVQGARRKQALNAEKTASEKIASVPATYGALATVGKKGLGKATKAAIGAGAVAGGLGIANAIKNKAENKKEEKTALDVVNETFDKIAGTPATYGAVATVGKKGLNKATKALIGAGSLTAAGAGVAGIAKKQKEKKEN